MQFIKNRSRITNPRHRISTLKDLYKIWFSRTTVKDRIKNASKEATYLFADVAEIASCKCYNLDTHNFESLLHRFFGECCLNVDVYNNKKQRSSPREWFVVPLSIIDEVINLIISGGVLNYKYDVVHQKLVLK